MATEIAMLVTSPHTRAVCQRLHLETVADLLVVGRAGILSNGRRDKLAVCELSRALSAIGVDWDNY